MENCLFCKIIKGEIPATKVYEDDDMVIFKDIDGVNLYVSSGIEYGKNGKNFIRINLATTKENCILAAKMLKEELRRY